MSCTCAACPVHRRASGWWPMKVPAWVSLLLLGCGGLAEREPGGITALCVTVCANLDDGSRECVVLTDPSQLRSDWWDRVASVDCSSPCPAQQVASGGVDRGVGRQSCQALSPYEGP
jgi:hypothetical protein